jgi:hypothetical protein
MEINGQKQRQEAKPDIQSNDNRLQREKVRRNRHRRRQQTRWTPYQTRHGHAPARWFGCAHLLRVDLVRFVEHDADLVILPPQRPDDPLELVRDVQLVRVKEQQD